MSVHGRKAVNPPVARVVEELAVVAEAPPPLVDAELPTVQSALDRADAVIQVLDARDPQSFRSAFLENLITETNGKDKLLFVLNKVDLIPRESSTAWLRHLRSSIPAKLRGSIKACLLKSSVKTSDDLSEGMQSKAVPWGRSRLLQILEEWAAEKLKQGGAGEGFTVTVMGLPNVSGCDGRYWWLPWSLTPNILIPPPGRQVVSHKYSPLSTFPSDRHRTHYFPKG